MKSLLIATHSAGKKKELAEGLKDLPIRIFMLSDIPEVAPCTEDGATFMENARRKARHYHEGSGFSTLADDSGLVVDALGGRPGIYSARFAGAGATDAQRIEKLLALMAGVPESQRTARFVCAFSIYEAGREVFAIERACEGLITEAPRGAQGFGYDPIFEVPHLGRTFAEISPEEKSVLSHRGQALSAASDALRHFLRANQR